MNCFKKEGAGHRKNYKIFFFFLTKASGPWLVIAKMRIIGDLEGLMGGAILVRL